MGLGRLGVRGLPRSSATSGQTTRGPVNLGQDHGQEFVGPPGATLVRRIQIGDGGEAWMQIGSGALGALLRHAPKAQHELV